MPTYKLYYFNLRGRAEAARWLFKLSGTDFEDIRLTREEWASKKTVLEVTTDDGKTTTIPQSGSIMRYLGREFGFCGKDNLEMARAEFLCEFMLDTMMKLHISETDEEKKKALLKQALDGPVSESLKLLEGYVLDCGYFVSDKVSIADVGFAIGRDVLYMFDTTLLEKTPKLKALVEKVRNLPEIKAWIAARPDTPM